MIEVTSFALTPVTLAVSVTVATDLASMAQVRQGLRLGLAEPAPVKGGARLTAGDGFEGDVPVVSADAHALLGPTSGAARLAIPVELLPRSRSTIELKVTTRERSGQGLGNQGWKDSFDSVQWADGRLAAAPIALSEVQAYAYEAAKGAAALLRAYAEPGADEWDEWAAHLSDAFRARFWTEDDQGAYPGIPLDRDKRHVDGIASNMCHLLGTGLRDVEVSAGGTVLDVRAPESLVVRSSR